MNEVAQAAAAAQAAEASAAEEAESAAVSGGGGSSQPEASGDTSAVYSGGSAEETGQPETSEDTATSAQTTEAPATASLSPTPSASPSMTPTPIVRNEEGETDSYAELSEDTLSEYYEVNATVADAEAFEKLASSEYAKNSRLDEIVQASDNKAIQRLTICMTEDEFKEFLEYIEDNKDIISFEEDVNSIDTENGVMIIIEKPEI